MNTELLQNIIRERFDNPQSTYSLFAKQEQAGCIQLAIDLDLDSDFRKEMISDFQIDNCGFWFDHLPDEETKQDNSDNKYELLNNK